MKKVHAVLVAIVIQIVAALPTNAAMIISRTGPLSDFYPYQFSETSFFFDVDGIVGPMTTNPPFAYRPIFQNGQPAPGWTYTAPQPHYVVKLTTPVPVSNGQWELYGAEDYNDYMNTDGVWSYMGGNDNNGGLGRTCPSPYCSKPLQVGNTTTFSFDGFGYAWWGSSGDFAEQRWIWFNGVHLYGELPMEDIAGNYSLQVFATNVPEPSTWILMFFGFGGIGILLRRRLVTPVTMRVSTDKSTV